jgi:hypothetical protein
MSGPGRARRRRLYSTGKIRDTTPESVNAINNYLPTAVVSCRHAGTVPRARTRQLHLRTLHGLQEERIDIIDCTGVCCHAFVLSSPFNSPQCR